MYEQSDPLFKKQSYTVHNPVSGSSRTKILYTQNSQPQIEDNKFPMYIPKTEQKSSDAQKDQANNLS